MRINVTFGLLGVISGLLALGALFLGVLSMRVAFFSGGDFVDAPTAVWAAFGLWNLFISFIAGWAAVEVWRALLRRTRTSRDQT
jgi:hypothetical protein